VIGYLTCMHCFILIWNLVKFVYAITFGSDKTDKRSRLIRGSKYIEQWLTQGDLAKDLLTLKNTMLNSQIRKLSNDSLSGTTKTFKSKFSLPVKVWSPRQ